jgi:hypothetical protein
MAPRYQSGDAATAILFAIATAVAVLVLAWGAP